MFTHILKINNLGKNTLKISNRMVEQVRWKLRSMEGDIGVGWGEGGGGAWGKGSEFNALQQPTKH